MVRPPSRPDKCGCALKRIAVPIATRKVKVLGNLTARLAATDDEHRSVRQSLRVAIIPGVHTCHAVRQIFIPLRKVRMLMRPNGDYDVSGC
jgi:hypothetical protein